MTTLKAFQALAEPNRLAILEVLREGEQPVGALVDRLSLGQPAVSKHLRVLKDKPHDGRAVPTLITQALRSEPLTITGDGSQTRSLGHVDDLTDALLGMGGVAEPGPINLGNPHEITILELAKTILELTGSASPIHYIPTPADDPLVRQPDINLARTLLGWSPTIELKDGLERTAEWFARELA